MTVAVSCNLSDGVVLGVDSAVTVMAQAGVAKVYENAEKLFQLGDRRIGVAVYGLGGLGQRGIGSYLMELVARDPGGVIQGASSTVEDIAEAIRSFFMDGYIKEIVPLLEKELGTPYADIPLDKRPALGLVIGGFSPGVYLSEVWEVLIPVHDKPNSARKVRGQGEYGTNWFAMYEPIRRYVLGFDIQLLQALVDYFVKRSHPLTATEEQEFQTIYRKYEYPIPFAAMPMEEGVNHVRFLVQLVINHHRFALGAQVVGGSVRLGKVTYKGEPFQLVSP